MITLTLIAPLAVSMGMPFPLGIVRVARDSGDLVPWAWGINGCASVVAAVLATLQAIHLGFTAVVLIGRGGGRAQQVRPSPPPGTLGVRRSDGGNANEQACRFLPPRRRRARESGKP